VELLKVHAAAFSADNMGEVELHICSDSYLQRSTEVRAAIQQLASVTTDVTVRAPMTIRLPGAGDSDDEEQDADVTQAVANLFCLPSVSALEMAMPYEVAKVTLNSSQSVRSLILCPVCLPQQAAVLSTERSCQS